MHQGALKALRMSILQQQRSLLRIPGGRTTKAGFTCMQHKDASADCTVHSQTLPLADAGLRLAAALTFSDANVLSSSMSFTAASWDAPLSCSRRPSAFSSVAICTEARTVSEPCTRPLQIPRFCLDTLWENQDCACTADISLQRRVQSSEQAAQLL